MPLMGRIAIAWLLLLLAPASPVAGADSEAERSFLTLYFSDEELKMVSATRSLKSVAGIAENVVTVTAEDIEIMNAHTVAEALYHVTGIELADFKGPGSEGNPSIHGSGGDKVTVLLDGVPLTSASNTFQLATLPVQMIQRIEVVKGPASSAWGSSFGGVVNVITKSVARRDHVGGTASASLGERGTSDARAEAYARSGRAGVYLHAGRMDSDGLLADHWFTHENVFGKASLDAGPRTTIDLAGYYHRSDSVNADFRRLGQDVYDAFDLETLYGKADLATSIADDVDLRLSAWVVRNDDNFYAARLGTDVRTRDAPIRFDRHGFSGTVAWRTGRHALVAGADTADDRFEREFLPPAAIDRQKYALYVNDTVTAGDLVVTPGLRYDHSSLAGGLVSPSVGATYLASRDLLFRAIVSRGFHDPAMVRYFDAPARGYLANRDLKPETIWSYQAGIEANVSDLLRTKLTLFYHDIDDILVDTPLGPTTLTTENRGRATTAGGELEILTNRFRGFVFTGGAHYERTKRHDPGDDPFADLREVHGVNASLVFDGKRGLRGTVKAHYLWWDLARTKSDSEGVVVDVNLDRRVLDSGRVAVELFAGAHNLFNADSYNDILQSNPGRWLEAGVRFSF